MENLFFFLWLFFFIFIFYLVYYFIKYKKNKMNTIIEYVILLNKFKIEEEKLNKRNMVIILSFCNAFIIANAAEIMSLVKVDSVWAILYAFFIVFVLIILVYGIAGMILKSKK